ncbi:MAG: fatty acid desaturase family protein [Imperialibacter sp.]|uniref:fatty acid desaturase family protein n=1 Tax=Imperialibacter sp. TaxID=2038411 RepID=UPI0030D9D881|tara:strand:+ start:322 stop:1386 length:1065 start_codon:yes stop_codon:yes gene_type:complete
MSAPKFSSQGNSFYGELRSRINEYFQEAGKPSTGNYKLYFKAVVLVLSWVGFYIHLVFFTPGTWLALTESVIMGGLTAAIGFNVMHDGSHGSFSRKEWVNKLAGLSLNFLGANVFMWNTKHNVIHHTYTNIDEIDDDIDARPFLRLCSTQRHRKIHRYQHIYGWFAYSLLYLYWVFFTDYKKYFTQKVGSMPLMKMKPKDHISFWGFKAIHAVVYMALPIYMVGFLPWLTGFLVMGLFAGLVLTLVFQLAHTVEHTHFPVPNELNKLEDEWAIHQIKTTANFATKNKLITWWVGGLNYQIEHHLFPKISHIHYPAISKIIKKVCEENGIVYIEYPRMRIALGSHAAYLKAMGQA